MSNLDTYILKLPEKISGLLRNKKYNNEITISGEKITKKNLNKKAFFILKFSFLY